MECPGSASDTSGAVGGSGTLGVSSRVSSWSGSSRIKPRVWTSNAPSSMSGRPPVPGPEVDEEGRADRVHQGASDFHGDDCPLANLMLSVMGAFAEFERALIGGAPARRHHPERDPRRLPGQLERSLARSGRSAEGAARRGERNTALARESASAATPSTSI